MVCTTPSRRGTWVARTDGSVYCFGDAGYHGGLHQLDPSQPPGGSNEVRPSAPIVGIAGTPDGGGYWLVDAEGMVYSFGNAAYKGPTPTFTADWGVGLGRKFLPIGITAGDGADVEYTIVCDGALAQPATYGIKADGEFAKC